MGIKFQKKFYNQIFHNCTIKKYGNGAAIPADNRSVSNPKGQALPYGNLFSSTSSPICGTYSNPVSDTYPSISIVTFTF